MKVLNPWRIAAFAAAAAACALLAGCEDLDAGPGRSLRPISSATLALMDKIGSSEAAPVLIRTYKKEAELEIWKMKADGQNALLKTYPMCRWSGQLGPKTREGDRQVPEGFYAITPQQMNPNSNYYLSFNVGYPNAYDQAWDRTGGNIMVHGVCSSAGCFSMTDAQIAEIYAIAREAFNGGQRAIQMQSFPFKMNAENLAKHRLDPNIAFWRELKNGADHFEVTKAEPEVLVCDRHYVFGAKAEAGTDARAPCPVLRRDDDVEGQVAAKAAADDAEVEKLAAAGVKPVRLVYEDGGQNASFAGRGDVSRPDALAASPKEIPLDAPAVPVKVAALAPAPVDAPALSVADAPTALPATPYAAPAAAPAAGLSIPGIGALTGWLKPSAAVASVEPAAVFPANAPLPPRRAGAAALAAKGSAPLDLAALKPRKAKKPLDPALDPDAAQ